MAEKAIIKVGGVDVYYDQKTFGLDKTRIPNQTKATKVSELLELVRLDNEAELLVALNGKSYKTSVETFLKRVVFPSLTELGLDKVDNTRDLDKPISTMTQEALDALSRKDTDTIEMIDNIIDQLSSKANKDHTHNSIDDIIGLSDVLDTRVGKIEYNTKINEIALQLDELDRVKANLEHTHDEYDIAITGIMNLLNKKISNDEFKVAIDRIMNLLRNKASANHIHLEFSDILNKLALLMNIKADKDELGNVVQILSTKADIEALLDYAKVEHGHDAKDINGLSELIASLASKHHEHNMSSIVGLVDTLNMKASLQQLNTKLDKEEFEELWNTIPNLEDIDLRIATKLDREEFDVFKLELDQRLANYVTKEELEQRIEEIPQASVKYLGCEWD